MIICGISTVQTLALNVVKENILKKNIHCGTNFDSSVLIPLHNLILYKPIV